jgi:hypothetical protein
VELVSGVRRFSYSYGPWIVAAAFSISGVVHLVHPATFTGTCRISSHSQRPGLRKRGSRWLAQGLHFRSTQRVRRRAWNPNDSYSVGLAAIARALGCFAMSCSVRSASSGTGRVIMASSSLHCDASNGLGRRSRGWGRSTCAQHEARDAECIQTLLRYSWSQRCAQNWWQDCVR